MTVLIAIYAPQYLGIADKFWSVVATGALAGAAGGAIATGSLSGAVKGAIFGAISAGIANKIGGYVEGLDRTVITKEAVRTALHGVSRSVITKLQSGRWSSGFWSGVASSIFAPIVGKYFAKAHEVVQAVVSGVLSGTVSVISGGKFANGAVTGAFTYLFNYLKHEAQDDLNYLESKGGKGKIVNHSGKENGFHVETEGGLIYVSPLRIPTPKDYKLAINIALVVPTVRVVNSLYNIWRLEGVVGKFYTFEAINDTINPSMPPITPHGAALNIINNVRE